MSDGFEIAKRAGDDGERIESKQRLVSNLIH